MLEVVLIFIEWGIESISMVFLAISQRQLPGGAQSPGIRSGNQPEPLPSGAQSPGRR